MNIDPRPLTGHLKEKRKMAYSDQPIKEAQELGAIPFAENIGDTSPVNRKTISQPASQEIENSALAQLKFGNDVKVLCIPNTDYRLICHYLDIDNIQNVKTAPFKDMPLITMLLQEALERFMESEEYVFAGEVNFEENGNLMPARKTVWTIRGENRVFTTGGMLFYENGDKKVVWYVYANPSEQRASITCFTDNNDSAKSYVYRLEEYARQKNCLRGLKLKDINIFRASFSEILSSPEYTWDNYYYTHEVRDMFQLEVFGFLANVDRYNRRGINRRGVMLKGKPGSGKTTLGHIVCNYVPNNTVIWITPDILSENDQIQMSIKLLYRLADFLSPVVVFLEDLDLFGEDRKNPKSSGDSLRLGALMNIMDGVNSVQNCITIATTNRIELVEDALRNRPGRFDRLVEIGSLQTALRERMFRDRLFDCEYEEKTLKELVEKTEGWTGAECEEFIKTLNLCFINEHEDEHLEKRSMTNEIMQNVLKTLTHFKVGGENGPGGKSRAVGLAAEAAG